MGWNFQSSIKSNADSSREILPSESNFVFIWFYWLTVFNYITELDATTATLGHREAGWKQRGLLLVQRYKVRIGFKSLRWTFFLLKYQQLIFLFYFYSYPPYHLAKMQHTHTLWFQNKSITEIETSITHKKSHEGHGILCFNN